MKEQRRKGKQKMQRSAFDTIVEELMHDETAEKMLEECMFPDAKKIRKIPLRYRIIALGFIRQYTLEEVNDKLIENGCDRLYSRSIREAGLIYAFQNRLSYEAWKRLQDDCEAFLGIHHLQQSFFTNASVTAADLEYYVRISSADASEVFRTRHLTSVMEQKIKDSDISKVPFRQFLADNAENFSLVREKTRYYFCKYLLFMIESRIDQYVSALAKGHVPADELERMAVFKGLTQLKRHIRTPDGCREFLWHSAISFRRLFDEFNYFFFEYVSMDWMDVLLEYFGNPDTLSSEEVSGLAAYLRKYEPERYGKLSDARAIALLKEETERRERFLDRQYCLQGGKEKPAENRKGENALRKYIKGDLDIDRTTLICFLLFFAGTSELSEENRLNRKRFTGILLECGYSGLQDKKPFDRFVIRYLESRDPVSFLMQEVTGQALRRENFYLYRFYQDSSSLEKEFQKLL